MGVDTTRTSASKWESMFGRTWRWVTDFLDRLSKREPLEGEVMIFTNGGWQLAKATEVAAPVISDVTGWAVYNDTQYTSGSPFALAGDSVQRTLPNNAASKIETQKPTDVDTFYDAVGQKITGRNGDGILITVELTGRPTTATATFLEVTVDIGGAVGDIYPRTMTFPKGNGVPRTHSFTVAGYTLDTWEANGGTVEVASNANIDLYGVRYIITRTHKAR